MADSRSARTDIAGQSGAVVECRESRRGPERHETARSAPNRPRTAQWPPKAGLDRWSRQRWIMGSSAAVVWSQATRAASEAEVGRVGADRWLGIGQTTGPIAPTTAPCCAGKACGTQASSGKAQQTATYQVVGVTLREPLTKTLADRELAIAHVHISRILAVIEQHAGDKAARAIGQHEVEAQRIATSFQLPELTNGTGSHCIQLRRGRVISKNYCRKYESTTMLELNILR
jgi:hypothetical protein